MIPSLFEKGSAGRRAIEWPRDAGAGNGHGGAGCAGTENGHGAGDSARGAEKSAHGIPAGALRQSPPEFPSLSQPDIVRHFTALAQRIFNVDSSFYPLGSCTMKHNPKVNETIAAMEGFRSMHPDAPDGDLQGTLSILWELQEMLSALTGLPGCTLQPAAGAHGEWTGLMLIRAWHEERGDIARRRVVLIPDTAHGTNPASAIRAGFQAREVKSDARGRLSLAALRAALTPEIAALMITNPNTLGLFEEAIGDLCAAVHEAGGLVYMDGANFNAIAGQARPGDFGVDAMHLNLHKTFSTPHGGGGPGSGPVCCAAKLEAYLPVPRIFRREDGRFVLESDRPKTIGKVRSYLGNLGPAIRAWAYLRVLGLEGVREMSAQAVVNANYLLAKLRGAFDVPYGEGRCMHEFVIDASRQKRMGVRAMDFAKALLDEGFHAPTTYFPLIVPEAMMIEPTETESVETLGAFAETMLGLARRAESNPGDFAECPRTTPVSRPDESAAARNPLLVWDAQCAAQFPPGAGREPNGEARQ